MDKLQTLDNIKRYGTIDAFLTVVTVVLTTYINNIYIDIITSISMIFWVLFIKNVAAFYDNSSLNIQNIIATIGLVVSMTGIGIMIRYLPQGSEDVLYEPSKVEIFLSFLMLGLSVVLIASIVMFMIVMYKLAKITKSKIFLYCFYFACFYLFLSVLSAVFEYGEMMEGKIVSVVISIAITGLFLYGIIKFYDEKKKLYMQP